MADHFLLFVPIDPKWQPTRGNADAAVELFKSMATEAGTVEAVFSDDVEFHHPYGNWSGVNCPACKADLEDWFYEALDEVYRNTAFTDLSVRTPCCGVRTSLNDLDFVWPAAFGRFVLESMNPGILMNEDQRKTLAMCLGLELREIWRHL